MQAADGCLSDLRVSSVETRSAGTLGVLCVYRCGSGCTVRGEEDGKQGSGEQFAGRLEQEGI